MSKFFILMMMAVAAGWAQQVNPCGSQPTSGTNSACINPLPTRQFGQPNLQSPIISVAPNLVEGRELHQPFAIAFDTSVTPPILYVVDTSNNRILAYQNPYSLANCGLANPTCGFANMAIGPGNLQYTLPGGPGNPGSNTGLYAPTSAAVDSNGNLYVMDSGNNRILRFPVPFKQTGAVLVTDLVIGQTTFNSGNTPNMGLPAPSAQSLYLYNGGTLFQGSMTIEPATGDLWVTDPGNNRALRYPTSQLVANTKLPAADLVVGQTNFTTGSQPQTPPNSLQQLLTTALFQPTGITFDSKDRLYIADGISNNFYRVLVYVPGFGIGMQATRVLGLIFQLSNQTTAPTFPNNYALGEPVGLFTTGENLWVCDAGWNRVVEYDIFENWPAAPTYVYGQPLNQQISPPMLNVLGQADFTHGMANSGQATPGSGTVQSPFGGAVNGTDLWIADTGNNRVLDFPEQTGATYTTASRVVGQLTFSYNGPNLIEGREVNFSTGFGGGGIAVDHNSSPPHVYIADTANNRILCYENLYSVGQNSAAQADLVIGQNGPSDYYEWLYNYPSNDPTTMSATGLSLPTDVLVDPQGNLWVADFGNGRVLRFPAPFSQPSGTNLQPNLVLGQFGFSGTPITSASSETMYGPFGLAMFSNGSLAVSDALLNRVLVFTKPSGGDFENSQAASSVLGQQNFTSSTASITNAGLNSPRHLATDSSDRLYVADTGNSRLAIWDGTQTGNTGSDFALQLQGFNQPQGVRVSSITGEVWLADSNNLKLYRLPEYDSLILETSPTTYPITSEIQTQTAPVAVELDDNDNVIIAETANRVTFYYAALAYQNSANFNLNPLAPGMLAVLGRYGNNFNFTQTVASVPLQTTLSDIQVLVNGVAAPIGWEIGTYILFQVPSSMPTSGTVTIVVQHQSTGQIIGTTSAQMAPFNPGFYATGGSGQLAATNPDGSANSAGNPVARGQQIVFYLTGAGAFSGVTDGTIPSSPVDTSVQPQILASAYGGQVPASDIKYSGTSFYPGVWQINFLVDDTFAPGENVITVLMNGVTASEGPFGPIQVYFYAK